MPILKRVIAEPPKEPRRLYAFVDSVVEAMPDRPHSRMSIQMDAIDAAVFDNTTAIDDDNALFLARISTTWKRFAQLFGFDGVKEGDWLEIQLKRTPQMPRAWLLPFSAAYEPQPPVNAVSVTRLEDAADVVASLEKSCVAPNAERLEDIQKLGQRLRAALQRELKISALDVGQAACVAFFRDGRCSGYFDVGAPLFFNKRSFPRAFCHIVAEQGFVILSHWDFDHFALVYRYPDLKKLDWYAPQQPVGPNTARLQRSLGSRLKFISGELTRGNLLLRRCTGTSPRDRNATGYAMRVQLPGAGILLTGDADYPWIPLALTTGANRLVIPHHGGPGSAPPTPGGGGRPIAVASYGIPNTYRHPDERHLTAHNTAGWRVRRTAAYGNPARPRGDRRLYPI